MGAREVFIFWSETKYGTERHNVVGQNATLVSQMAQWNTKFYRTSRFHDPFWLEREDDWARIYIQSSEYFWGFLCREELIYHWSTDLRSEGASVMLSGGCKIRHCNGDVLEAFDGVGQVLWRSPHHHSPTPTSTAGTHMCAQYLQHQVIKHHKWCFFLHSIQHKKEPHSLFFLFTLWRKGPTLCPSVRFICILLCRLVSRQQSFWVEWGYRLWAEKLDPKECHIPSWNLLNHHM